MIKFESLNEQDRLYLALIHALDVSRTRREYNHYKVIEDKSLQDKDDSASKWVLETEFKGIYSKSQPKLINNTLVQQTTENHVTESAPILVFDDDKLQTARERVRTSFSEDVEWD